MSVNDQSQVSSTSSAKAKKIKQIRRDTVVTVMNLLLFILTCIVVVRMTELPFVINDNWRFGMFSCVTALLFTGSGAIVGFIGIVTAFADLLIKDDEPDAH